MKGLTGPGSLLDGLLSLLLPSDCVLCGRGAEPLCRECLNGLPLLNEYVCPGCALPGDGSLCRRCQDGRPAYSETRALAPYDGRWREVVHHLKYGRRPELASLLGGLMVERLGPFLMEVDLVTSVPPDRGRLMERGYDQSELLARAMAIGLPSSPPYRETLARTRQALPQHGLPRKERLANPRGLFKLLPATLPEGGRVLLVDDVMTTGATLGECAAVLVKGGAASVKVAVLARRQ